LDRLADLALAEGRVMDAHRLAQQAVELSRPNQGSYQYLTAFLHTFGETLKAEGDLKGARQQFQEALQLRQKANESGLVAESEARLASLDLDEGHKDQAEPLLRAAITQFEKEHEDPSAAGAYTLLSQCLLVQGKLEDSRQAIQRAIELSHASSDPALKLPAAIQAARIQATGSDPRSINAARQQIRSTIATAKQLGYYPIELDARRALAELNITSNPTAAHAQLKALAIEARARGLELIARQAEQLAAASQSKVDAKRAGN
jgi:tetratricopeptide (TPR) repeat protein